MDDLRRDLPLSHLTPSVPPRGARTGARRDRLGQTLAEARHDKRLELRDLAEITNIRTSHLEALEAGRYSELPEEVYSKNFVRLYAQAVGLDPARMLLLYKQERRSSGDDPPRETGLGGRVEPGLAGRFDDPRLGRLARMLLTLLLVGGTVLTGLWAFNRLLFTPPTAPTPATTAATTPVPPAATPSEAPAGAPDTAPIEALPAAAPVAGAAEMSTVPPAAANTLILLSLRTTPPGAEVSIDGYRLGRTPISDAPVRAGERTVTLTRGGYRTFERTFDLSRDRRLNIALTPAGSLSPAATGAAAEASPRAATGDTATPTATPAATVTVEVTAEAWLEVYRGGARGEGERLVYETAQPGSRYNFSEPVYLFSGNAGGVSVSRTTASGETETEALGAPGAVGGRAY